MVNQTIGTASDQLDRDAEEQGLIALLGDLAGKLRSVKGREPVISRKELADFLVKRNPFPKNDLERWAEVYQRLGVGASDYSLRGLRIPCPNQILPETLVWVHENVSVKSLLEELHRKVFPSDSISISRPQLTWRDGERLWDSGCIEQGFFADRLLSDRRDFHNHAVFVYESRLAYSSAAELWAGKKYGEDLVGVTLAEWLLLILKYKLETHERLHSDKIVLCAGSRFVYRKELFVPGVFWERHSHSDTPGSWYTLHIMLFAPEDEGCKHSLSDYLKLCSVPSVIATPLVTM